MFENMFKKNEQEQKKDNVGDEGRFKGYISKLGITERLNTMERNIEQIANFINTNTQRPQQQQENKGELNNFFSQMSQYEDFKNKLVTSEEERTNRIKDEIINNLEDESRPEEKMVIDIFKDMIQKKVQKSQQEPQENETPNIINVEVPPKPEGEPEPTAVIKQLDTIPEELQPKLEQIKKGIRNGTISKNKAFAMARTQGINREKSDEIFEAIKNEPE